MDEAELLGDRIGIISAGRLQCCGTALFLKNALGEGNNLTIVKDMNKIQIQINELVKSYTHNLIDLTGETVSTNENTEKESKISFDFYKENTERLIEFIRQYIPTAYLKDETLREYNFVIPLNERANPEFWKLFTALDKEKAYLNVDSYGIHDVSLEEIFIKAAQIKTSDETEQEDNDPEIKTDTDDESSAFDSSNFSTESKNSLYNLDYIYADLETGYRFYLKQFFAMLVKRYLYNKRNWVSLLTQIILPALFICVAMTVALSAPGFFDLPKLELSPAQYHPLTKPEGIYVPFSHSVNPIDCKSNSQKVNSASSKEIAETFKYLTGLGSTCVLNKYNITLRDLINFNYTNSEKQAILNSKLFGQPDSFCSDVFNPNADIDIKYFQLSAKGAENFKSFTSFKKEFYPKCTCLKDFSGFECATSSSFDSPPKFKLTTHETLLNISGSNESNYYLYTTDLFRLKRYGGLSFDNENASCSEQQTDNDHLISESLKDLKLIQNMATNRKARIWYNNKGFHAMPTFLNVMNNALLRANVKKSLVATTTDKDIESDVKASGYAITVINHPMNQTNNYLSTEYLLEGSDVLISIFTIVAMSFVNASFVLFLVYERSIKSLHLQFLIGLNPFLYWLTNFIWDMLNYLLPASCVIIILKIFNVPAYVQGN
jgi:ATP-binding cassette subfamily A (ABC1) protein 2